MSIDQKTARHICNVTRRQIQNSFPNLHLHFCVHGENRRREAFTKEAGIINEHPAGKFFVEYHDKETTEKVMQKNKSRFVSIARHNKPGFLGFSRSNEYMALSFINYERFSSETNVRNHTYLAAWHAIVLYRDYTSRNKKTEKAQQAKYIDDHNLLIPNITLEELCFRNLAGDIFSACAQLLLNKDDVISHINNQRIIDTLTPQKGFRSEQYPFPACIDQLEAMVEKLLPKYKKEKKTMLAASKMTDEIAQTYDITILERWKSFSLPAQQMAWAGELPETILGAALYTSENTYTQSTADMVAEKMDIRPEPITGFQENNPFTNQITNEQTHINLGKKIIKSILETIDTPSDYKKLLNVADKQNDLMLEGKVIGWCAGALLRAAEMIKHCQDPTLLQNILKQSEDVFLSEFNAIPWDTLNHFSFQIFRERRKGKTLEHDDLIEISTQNEEFTTINNALYALKLALQEKVPDKLPKVHLEQQETDLSTFAKTSES